MSGTIDSLELEAADPVPTIHDLLRHTSGLTFGGEKTAVNSLYGAADLWNLEFTLAQMAAKLADLPLQNQPGTAFEYGMSFEVLGLLVQVISGQPFDIHVHLAPLPAHLCYLAHERGFAAMDIMKMLGHSSPQMVMRYLRVRDAHLLKKAEQINSQDQAKPSAHSILALQEQPDSN